MWSKRMVERIGQDGSGLFVVHENEGYVRVGNQANPRLYLADGSDAVVWKIRNGYYLPMIDAIERIRRRELFLKPHIDLIERGLLADIADGKKDGPQIGAIIGEDRDGNMRVYLDGFSYPDSEGSDHMLMYVENIYSFDMTASNLVISDT